MTDDLIDQNDIKDNGQYLDNRNQFFSNSHEVAKKDILAAEEEKRDKKKKTKVSYNNKKVSV